MRRFTDTDTQRRNNFHEERPAGRLAGIGGNDDISLLVDQGRIPPLRKTVAGDGASHVLSLLGKRQKDVFTGSQPYPLVDVEDPGPGCPAKENI